MRAKAAGDDVALAAIERERGRIGALLHEGFCQTLAGVRIQLDVMLRRLQAGQAVSVADLTLVRDHVHEAIDTTRTISGDSRSLRLEGSGLMEALGQLTDAAGKKLSCEYVCEQPVFLADAKAGLALLRIAEEALANAHRHAPTARVVVSLAQTPGAITLKIRDDGKGFRAAKRDGRISGLDLMRRNARAAGARLSIKSGPGKGTVISCTLPQAQ